jgi:hypothetical protein
MNRSQFWGRVSEEQLKALREKAVAVPEGWMAAFFAKGGAEEALWTEARALWQKDLWMILTPDLKRVPGKTLEECLAAFEQLPEARRKPAVTPVEGFGDKIRLPQKVLVLRWYCQLLGRDGAGAFRRLEKAGHKLTADVGPAPSDPKEPREWKQVLGQADPGQLILWVPEAEWKALVPANPTAGQRFAMPEAVRDRLVPTMAWNYFSTYLEVGPSWWKPEEFRSAGLELSVEQVSEARVTLRLEGKLLLEGNRPYREVTYPKRFEAEVHGVLEYDRPAGRFVRFDVVTLGDYTGYWKANLFAVNMKPRPVGTAFELATGESALDYSVPRELMHAPSPKLIQKYRESMGLDLAGAPGKDK